MFCLFINQLKRRQRDAGNLAPDEDYGTATRIPDSNEFDLEAIWDEEWERNLLVAALFRTLSYILLQLLLYYQSHQNLKGHAPE